MSYNKQSELRQAFASLCIEAKSNGIKLAEVIPAEMQEYIQDLRHVQEAKAYIVEVEAREQELLNKNTEFRKRLAQAQQAAKDMSADHDQREIDLKQAEKHIEFYKGLQQDADDRAKMYQAKWQDTLQKQGSLDQAKTRIATLDKECADQKATIFGLLQENRAAVDIFDSIREKDLKTLEEKEERLQTMEKYVIEQETRYRDIEEESDAFEKTYGDIVERLQDENDDCATTLNKKTQILRAYEQRQSAAVSEARILSKYYERSRQILVILQRIFQQLLNLDEKSVQYLPDYLHYSLDSAQKDIEAFHVVSRTYNEVGLDIDETRTEIARMGRSATGLQMSMQDIAEDVADFMRQLKQKPGLFSLVQVKLGRFPRMD